ncbi:MAG: acyl-CoA desaturase [Spirochaetia bacterium]|nr:acyl-CoA desaturase [Spirochaetia bacterium]
MEKITFQMHRGFHEVLKARVNEYFATRAIRPRDNWQMYLKTALIATWVLMSYISLVFLASSWYVALPLVLSFAFAICAVGFNIQHDGAHQAFSNSKNVNWLMAFTMDLIGGSHVFWRRKHNILHHTYTNINGVDEDIFDGSMFRLSPDQSRKKIHRFQHFYTYALYAFLTLKWMFYDDWKSLFRVRFGKADEQPRISNRDVILFVATKAFHASYSLIIPALFHPIWLVILFNLLFHFVLGFMLAVVFQMAHAVGDVAFPTPDKTTGDIDNEWAIHQVETTANFAMNNPIIGWYAGGLNFQIEHHLFPRICHIHYRPLSAIVQKTCAEFGVHYQSYSTFLKGFVAHFRWLRTMGKAYPFPETATS